MKILGVSVQTKEIIIAAVVGAGAVWALKNLVIVPAAKAVADIAPEAAQAVNPVNNDNIFNRAFESLYQAVTGSDQSPGADLYDLLEGDSIQ